MDRQKKINNLMGWLICVAIALFFCLIILRNVSSTISYDNYALKWQLCGALNFSGMTCDVWWSAFADLPNATSVIMNYSANLTNYYSKADIDALFRSLTNTNTTSGNVSMIGFVTRAEFDNQTLALRNSIMDNYITNTTFYFELNKLGYEGTSGTGTGNFNVWWVVGGVGICVVIYVIYQATRKGKYRGGYQNPAVTIPSASSDAQKIGLMEMELAKMKNKSANAEKDKKEFKKLPE